MILLRSILFIVCTIIYSVITQKSRGKEPLSTDFVNLQVSRTIDLAKLVIKIETRILMKSNKIEPISSYRFPMLKNNSIHLININAQMKSSSEENDILNLKISKQNSNINDEFDFYDVNFKLEPMNHEEERVLTITEEYYERLELLPKKMTIKQNQLVLFKDTINFLSFYTTNSQKTNVNLPFETTELMYLFYNRFSEYTKKYGERKKGKILYEINKPMAPQQRENLRIHYMYNKAISVLNEAVRIFEVSHWGNIAVEEKFKIENKGAKLEGEFGRIDFDDHGRNGGRNSLGNMNAALPMKAFGLWYRDEIGNVTTSHATREWDHVKLQLYPRFPILGGWKSNFYIGYNLPTKFHVTTDSHDNYSLNLTFGLPFVDIVARNYTMKVVLPEGASEVKVDLPIDAKYHISYEKTFSYLDFWGRTTCVITMKNVYDHHNIYFTINYKYSAFYLYWKPMLVVMFFFSLFVLLAFYFRLDFTLHKKSKTE